MMHCNKECVPGRKSIGERLNGLCGKLVTMMIGEEIK